MTTFGFVGLGDMGGPMAANLAAGGAPLVVFDVAGTVERAPDGAAIGESVAGVAGDCDVMFVCVPDGAASLAVAQDIAGADRRRVRAVVNLSTVGIEAAQQVAEVLNEAGVDYVDAPVSGGRAGAVKGTITLMWAGSRDLLFEVGDTLKTFSGNVFHVGDEPGQGQALKLLNNFLSSVAMAATSEAVSFGLSQGLDMGVMLDALNVSTGQNSATMDKFPNRIATGTYDAGFRMALMQKDVGLYLDAVRGAGTRAQVGKVMGDVWAEALSNYPEGDFTEIFKMVRGE